MLGSLELFWRLPLTMVVVWTYDGYLVLANPTCWKMLGWSHDTVESVPYFELIHPDEQQTAVTTVEQLIKRSGSRFGDEVRMLCRDGCYRWTRWNTSAAPENQLLCSVGLDLTDTRPADDGARVQVGTWDWDLRTATVTLSGELFGPAAGAGLGYQDFLRTVHPADRVMLDRSLHGSVTSGRAFSRDVRITGPDGRLRRVHLAGRLAGKPGEPEHMSGIARHVTERTPAN